MPFSGAGDPNLPSNVKKMPAAKRARWARIWNSVFKNCRSPRVGAAGSVSKCEGTAFRFANGAVKELEMENEIEALTIMREKAEGEEAEILGSAIQELKEKCPSDEMKPNPIFAGSTSFNDYDDFVEAQEQEMQVRDTTFIFRGLVDNIFSREDWNLSRKASAVVAAARELSARVQGSPDERKGLFEKVKEIVWLAWPSGKGERTVDPKGESTGVFMSFKDAKGIWRWMVINTNKFEDREGEIFSEKSHKEYIAYVEKTGDWPELWLWHTPGTRIGIASLVDYVDGFVVHTGTYDEGFDDVAERLQKMRSKIGVSHGYEYLEGDEKDGVYDHYRTFELTLCPAARAANIWGTGFETFVKEVGMGFSKEKRDFFVEALTEGRVAALEEKLPALAKELEGKGVSFKDMVDDLFETKTGEEEETEEEGTPVVEEPEVEETSEEEAETLTVEERLTALEAGQGKVLTAIGELTSSVKAANESVGERIEEALSGEQPPKTNGDRPSESAKTEVLEEEAEEVAVGFSEATPKESPARTLVEDLLHRGPAVSGS